MRGDKDEGGGGGRGQTFPSGLSGVLKMLSLRLKVGPACRKGEEAISSGEERLVSPGDRKRGCISGWRRPLLPSPPSMVLRSVLCQLRSQKGGGKRGLLSRAAYRLGLLGLPLALLEVEPRVLAVLLGVVHLLEAPLRLELLQGLFLMQDLLLVVCRQDLQALEVPGKGGPE